MGGLSTAGKVLKSLTGWGRSTADGHYGLNGTDVYGFSVLPTGYVEQWGGSKGHYWKYEYESTQVLFWSTTQYGNGVTAFTVGFHRNSDAVLIDNHVKMWFGCQSAASRTLNNFPVLKIVILMSGLCHKMT